MPRKWLNKDNMNKRNLNSNNDKKLTAFLEISVGTKYEGNTYINVQQFKYKCNVIIILQKIRHIPAQIPTFKTTYAIHYMHQYSTHSF